MSNQNRDQSDVNARIVYWGIEGSGKSTSLRVIAEKLRSDHRGQLRAMPTGLDPTMAYEVLPIELGQVGGLQTRIEIVAVPGAAEHAPTRKQLLDQVDGVVFVIDAQRDRIDENLASFDELRGSLAAYGRSLSDVPLVFQYNKRDLSDPFALEELHRKLDVRGVAAFESVATEGRAVLQALTTASKAVIRHLRYREPATASAPRPALPQASVELPAEEPSARPAPSLRVESTPGSERGLVLRSAGDPERLDERTVRVPVTLEDDQGRRIGLALTVRLEEILGSGPVT
jgi:signal recognition particle receptor subunit beta